MMQWEYRVFRENDGGFVIREVLYDSDGSIVACTQDSVEPFGESLEELAQDIEWFKEALNKSVLTLADIPVHEKRSHNGARSKKGKRISLEQLRRELELDQTSHSTLFPPNTPGGNA